MRRRMIMNRRAFFPPIGVWTAVLATLAAPMTYAADPPQNALAPSLAPSGETEPPTAPLELGGQPPEGSATKIFPPDSTSTPAPAERGELVQAPNSSSKPSSAISPSENTSSVQLERDLRTPHYQTDRPSWAIQVAGALKGVGKNTRFPNGFQSTENNTIRGFSIQAEYQPVAFQDFGVVSFGPSLNWYPIFAPNPLISNRFGLWSAGGQARYQARFFKEQTVVPIIGASAEMWQYRFASGASGHVNALGGFLGGMLLLNSLDTDGAASFYVNFGVLRSYLVAELRALSGSDQNLNLSGVAFFFGLRIEF